jgi:uncharacterized protein
MNPAPQPPTHRIRTGALALAAVLVPFHANDAANILVTQPGPWLAIDYAVRLAALGIAAVVLHRDAALRREHLGAPKISVLATVAWTAAVTAIGLYLIVGPGRAMLALWPATHVGRIPIIADPTLRILDLSLGLLLVAASEEIAFRAIALPVFADGFGSRIAAVAVTSVLFGFAHWSIGAGAIVQTALAGAALAVLTRATGSVWPAVVAHYVIDLVAFG